MILDVKFTEISRKLAVNFASDTQMFASTFGEIQNVTKSVTVQSISESTDDGGSNVVIFSDGTTLTVKNGKAGADGKDGKTPYIQNGYWHIDGVNTEVKALGVDGKDATVDFASDDEVETILKKIYEGAGSDSEDGSGDNIFTDEDFASDKEVRDMLEDVFGI